LHEKQVLHRLGMCFSTGSTRTISGARRFFWWYGKLFGNYYFI